MGSLHFREEYSFSNLASKHALSVAIFVYILVSALIPVSSVLFIL